MSIQTIGALTVLNDHDVKWEIKEFLSHNKKDKFLTSPEFNISGTQLYLKISPEGQEQYFRGFVSLHLKEKSFEKPKGVICNTELQKPDGRVEKRRDVCWAFNENSTEYGYHYLYERLKIENWLSKLTPSGNLTVIFNFLLITESFDSLSRWDSTSTNLLDMFTAKRDCDVKLKVTSSWLSYPFVLKENPHATSEDRSKEILAHKSVLADRCPKLADMCEVKLEDEQLSLITINDWDPDDFEEFLRCLYSGRPERFSNDIFKVYQIASKFGANELNSLCKVSIMAHLSIENICDVILANFLHERDLQDKIHEFMKANYDQIILTRKWKLLQNTDARLVSHLLQGIGKMKRVCC